MQRESMLSVCESIQYYSGGGRQGLFSGYESRDKHETGSIYAKEGHAGIFSPSGRELLSKLPVKSWTYMDWERHFNIFSLRQKQNRI